MNAANDIYNELIAPVEKQMMQTVFRIVRDPEDAADTFQNALTFIWKNLKKIHHHPNPHAYILRVCVSSSYDTLRKRARRLKRERPINFEDHALMPDIGSENAVLRFEHEQAIQTAIASLPCNQARAVLLHIIEGLSFQTVAEVLGCRESTARSHVSKGKARLRELLVEFL